MGQGTTDVIHFPEASSEDVLTGILREGAQKLLADAIEAEIDAVFLALECDGLAPQKGTQDGEIFPHVLRAPIVRQPEHVLDDEFVREPDSQRESTRAGGLRRERLLRERGGMAWVAGDHSGAEFDPVGLASEDRGGRDGIEAKDIGQPEGREASLFEVLGVGDEAVERAGSGCCARHDSDSHIRSPFRWV